MIDDIIMKVRNDIERSYSNNLHSMGNDIFKPFIRGTFAMLYNISYVPDKVLKAFRKDLNIVTHEYYRYCKDHHMEDENLLKVYDIYDYRGYSYILMERLNRLDKDV